MEVPVAAVGGFIMTVECFFCLLAIITQIQGEMDGWMDEQIDR